MSITYGKGPFSPVVSSCKSLSMVNTEKLWTPLYSHTNPFCIIHESNARDTWFGIILCHKSSHGESLLSHELGPCRVLNYSSSFMWEGEEFIGWLYLYFPNLYIYFLSILYIYIYIYIILFLSVLRRNIIFHFIVFQSL